MKKVIITCLLLMHAIILHPVLNLRAQDYFPGEKWRTGMPGQQGMDRQRIRKFINLLHEGNLLPPVSSFVVVKNGYLVVNEYFGSYRGNEPHTLQSVTKSITSTLVGAALEQGYIQSLEQKIVDFFPEYTDIKHLDKNKKAMNLRHALTMQTGQAWTGEQHLDRLYQQNENWFKYILDYEMKGPPGEKWYYNSGIAILLGSLLQNATGTDTRDFARKYLFEPLEIDQVEWRWGHRGVPHAGGGLFLKPVDLARIGYLYLRDGRWNGKQILPDWWVRDATTRHVPRADTIGSTPGGYGYMWWLIPLDEDTDRAAGSDIYMAYGHWGQFLFVIPAYDMIVVFTCSRSATYEEELLPVSLLYDYILPSVAN